MLHFSPPGDSELPADSPAQGSAVDTGRRRRGATAMEYLFVISLILLGCIMGVGYFGQITRDSAKQSSDAIQKATKGK